MKRAILPALAIALLLAVPAIPQGGTSDTEKRIEQLEQAAADQQKQIKDLQGYVNALKKEAATLVKHLARADKGGFTYPAPNVDAKEELLKGLQSFAAVASSGKVKQAAADGR